MREVNPANLGFKGPLLLTGFFETALQQHFFTPDAIFDDALREILWKPDNAGTGVVDTKIFIGVKIIPDPKKSEFRPAILIDRGEWKRTSLGIHDRNGLGEVLYGDKIDRWDGSHTFTILAKTYASVEIIAHEVATFFEVYGQLLAEQVCVDRIQLNSISPVQVFPENNESYQVVVSVSYEHHNQWSLKELRPKIRHIRPLITVQDYDARYEPKTTLIDLKYSRFDQKPSGGSE